MKSLTVKTKNSAKKINKEEALTAELSANCQQGKALWRNSSIQLCTPNNEESHRQNHKTREKIKQRRGF
jgi:hypothetical protein